VAFKGNNSFTSNIAAKGGGQYLVNSVDFFSQNTTFIMDGNNATAYGGAVYVVDSNPASYCFPDISKLERCFYQIHGLFEEPFSIMTFSGYIAFTNNLASSYGGGINAQVTILNVNIASAGGDNGDRHLEMVMW